MAEIKVSSNVDVTSRLSSLRWAGPEPGISTRSSLSSWVKPLLSLQRETRLESSCDPYSRSPSTCSQPRDPSTSSSLTLVTMCPSPEELIILEENCRPSQQTCDVEHVEFLVVARNQDCVTNIRAGHEAIQHGHSQDQHCQHHSGDGWRRKLELDWWCYWGDLQFYKTGISTKPKVYDLWFTERRQRDAKFQTQWLERGCEGSCSGIIRPVLGDGKI